MEKLCEITIPGLSMTADFPAVQHRLLADFPRVVDVLPMTTPATVLVVHTGEPEFDCWLDALSDSVATRRTRLGHRREYRHACRLGDAAGSFFWSSGKDGANT